MPSDATSEGGIDCEKLREFIEDTRESAEMVEAGEYVNKDHANGVSVGLRWAADELEAVIDDER
jgi:hypothetical protein